MLSIIAIPRVEWLKTTSIFNFQSSAMYTLEKFYQSGMVKDNQFPKFCYVYLYQRVEWLKTANFQSPAILYLRTILLYSNPLLQELEQSDRRNNELQSMFLQQGKELVATSDKPQSLEMEMELASKDEVHV